MTLANGIRLQVALVGLSDVCSWPIYSFFFHFRPYWTCNWNAPGNGA